LQFAKKINTINMFSKDDGGALFTTGFKY
jgi:hypothetical protein